jgi:pectate lyase
MNTSVLPSALPPVALAPATPATPAAPAARAPAIRALALALLASAVTITATADDIALPLPSVRWDPIESGTSIPNTGTKDGLAAELTDFTFYMRKATVNNNFNNSAAADLITADGIGPFGQGRAIDFSSNPGNGRAPIVNTDPALASPLGGITKALGGANFVGLPELTVTLWYKLDSGFTESGRYTTLFRSNSVNLLFLNTGAPSFSTSVKNASGLSETARLDGVVNSTITQPGKWVFVACVWSGQTGQITIYQGNEAIETSVNKTNIVTARGQLADAPDPYLSFGFHNFDDSTNNGRRFDGWLADIRFYNSALTIEQIEKIRSGSASGAVTTYLPTIKSWADTALAADYTDAKIDTATASQAPNGVTNDRLFHAAATAARLWLLGGKTEPACADRAFYILRALRNQRALAPAARFDIGFQARFSFAEACAILIENDYATLNPAFDAALIADLKEMARSSLGPGDTSDNNVGAFSAAGTTRALALWPDLDAGGAWTDYIKTYWTNWTARHDTQENSLNYNKAFLAYTILTARHAAAVPGLDATAMRADLAHPGTRAMLTRWRDQLSGGGAMPHYGDDGNGTPLPHLDNWPACFEWAAKTYADPTFRWAANTCWRLIRNGTVREPLNLLLMTYADEWGDLAIEPVQPPAASLLQTRATALSPAETDKIILAPSRDSGAPFTLAEVFSHGWHSHIEQIASITSHQYNNTLFLYGLGYNNRASDHASMVLINPASLPFPWRGYPENNTWYEAAIPTARLSEITDTASPLYGAGGRHIIDQPLWRFEQHNSTTSGTAWLSDWRLVAADGTETQLLPLTDPTGWPSGASATTTAGPTGTPNTALSFTIAPQITNNQSTFLRLPAAQRKNMSVLPSEHPYVKFWWKVDLPTIPNSHNPDDSILAYREDYYDGAGERSNGATAWLQPFTPATADAKVETATAARYGSLTIDGYFTLSTRLTRRLVQLDDGTLVIHDTLLPDTAADGRHAGPVWQLDAGVAPAQVAPGVFDATGFFNTRTLTRSADRLLVVMEKAPGRDFGSTRPPSPLWMGANPYATYARSTLRAGVPVSFVTVLLPNDGSTPATDLAARVRIQRNAPDSVVVQLDTPAATTTTQVTLGPGDTWNVDTIATPAPAAITLSNLIQAYDGAPKPVTLTTTPAGLSTIIFYGEERTTTAPTELGAYPVTAQITAPGYHGEATGTLLIRPPSAYIMEQPLPRVAAAGDTVTFSILASGLQPITYQWEKSPDGLTAWAAVGTNSDTLTLATLTTADAGFYRVTATNDIGAGPVSDTSATVELAIIPAPVPAPRADGAALAATGGGDTPAILVTNETDLRAYAALDTPATLTLRGVITLAGGPLVLSSDKTLQGLDAGATLDGQLQIGPAASNIIVRGLTLANPATALAITAATDIHLEHLTLFAATGGPLATIDSLSDNITLAYSELYFTTNTGTRHALATGAAGLADPAGITLHHNTFHDASRATLATNARVHLYNNTFATTASGSTTANLADTDAQLLVERNLIASPLFPYAASSTASNAHTRGRENLLDGLPLSLESNTADYVPGYPYHLAPAAGLDTLLDAPSGVAGNTAGAASAHSAPPATLTITGTEGHLTDGLSFTLTSTLSGATAAAYQWRRDHRPIDDATAPSLTIPYARQNLSGAYTLEATLPDGAIAVSNPRRITIGAPVPPMILRPILPVAGQDPDWTGITYDWQLGENVTLLVSATGDPVLRYQWQKKKGAAYNPLPGATRPTLNLGAAILEQSGAYRVVITNHSGTVTSADFTVTIRNAAAPYRVGNTRGDNNGGGALSPWCAAALALLAAARLYSRKTTMNNPTAKKHKTPTRS